jgi:DNA-binding transcriptional ArsR family regulator
MLVVQKREDGMYSLPANELSPEAVRALSSELAQKIASLLAKEPLYPIEIARRLNVHEQKVYYHIRNLEKAGIITVVKKETKQGAVANFYAVEKPAFVLRFTEMEKTTKLTQGKNESSFLQPFISEGQLHALIVVGSPDPHGPDKARSRDGYYGMDLALFLGTFLSYVPKINVKLDTEIRDEDLQNNLIIIGGPIVNKVMEKVNAQLPIRFEQGSIYSSFTHENYPQDECGIVVKAVSPFNKDRSILVVAGKRFSGTRAAIIAFLKHFDKVQQGNVHSKSVMAHVVEGVDLDSDGIVDDCEFRE